MKGCFLVSFQLLDLKGNAWKENYKAFSLEKVLECIEKASTFDGFTLTGLEVKYPYFGDNEKISIY